MHITASVFINDDESSLDQDNEVCLEKTGNRGSLHSQYKHNGYEDSADVHLGTLDFGTCEQKAVSLLIAHQRLPFHYK
ncbi:MAG TPA: hypothetical protein VJ869_06300 [Sphaerochaeta sp.]|nr:hypothetical protein [Sphaerochaeta sp.]